jgi:hypothetical protein
MRELAEQLHRLADQLADTSEKREQRQDELMSIHDDLLMIARRLAQIINSPN